METSRITYLFDPLCGWCYGASDIIVQLAAKKGLSVVLMPSGLFCGWNALPMDDAMASHSWKTDQRIARLTGKTFSADYRSRILGDRKGRVDSRLATAALTAVSLTDPAQELTALRRIQTARFIEGRDVTSGAVLHQILTDLQLGRAAQMVQDAPPALAQTSRDRIVASEALMARLGASSVPALVIGDDTGQRLITTDVMFENPDLVTRLSPAWGHTH